MSKNSMFVIGAIVGSVLLLGVLIFSQSGKPTSFENDLIAMAEGLGMDGDQFFEDYKSDEIRKRVDGEIKEADDAGIRSTPTVMMNGEIVTADPDYAGFRLTVEQFIQATPEEELPIVIDVYDDYQCPFCANFYTIPFQAEAEFGDQIEVVKHYRPLDEIHPLARRYSYAAEAAKEQGKFNEMSRAIFEREEPSVDYSVLDTLGEVEETDSDTGNE